MGSGKSSIGKIVANKLNYEFIDLDNYISDKLNTSIVELFEKKGELYFRKMEHQFLQEILNSDINVVLSLGGGTPCYYNNYEFYYKQKNIASFYLKATLNTLYDRLASEKVTRPLLKSFNDDELKEFIAKHLFERSEFYLKSDFVIDVNEKAVESISKEIIYNLT